MNKRHFLRSKLNSRASSRHFRPTIEPLEARLALAIGVFNDDFSNDADPAKPGFDTAGDGLEIVNTLPRYGVSQGPTDRGGYYYLQPGNPGDPGWGLHADGHVLGIVSSNFGVAQVEFSLPTPGSPGGPEVDEEVTGIGVSVQGFGRVIIIGETGRIDVTVNGPTWQRIAGDRDDLLPSGVELGTIVRMYVFSYEAVAIDNVTVQVGRPDANDLPTAVDDFIVVNREFGQSEIFDPLTNDFDLDGDALQFVFFAQPPRGTVTRVDDLFGNYRGLTYRADADALADPTFREDSFTYIISDAVNATATGTVRLVLNTQPSAAIDEYDVPHGLTGPLRVDAANGILANDFDRDGDSLMITAHGQPRHGTVTLLPDGSFEYTPTTPDGRVLSDSFTYTISDGYFQSHSFVSVRVPNEVPIVRDDFIVVEHGLYAIDRFDVIANDPGDPEGDLIGPPRIVAEPQHGTLSVLPDGQLRYIPEGDQVFSDTFTYRRADPYAAVDGESNLATVRILVPNLAPVARHDTYRVAPETTLVVPGADGVLQNDFDPDLDFLIRATLTKQPGYGTVTLNDDGSFTYVPDDYFEGTDTFGYVAEDGIAQSHAATVTIVATAGEPLAREDLYVIEPDSPARELDVLDNDWDPDGRPFFISSIVYYGDGDLTLALDGSVHYEPLAGFEGFDSFSYNISNGIERSPPVTVHLQITDDPTVPDTNFDHYSLLHDSSLYEPPYGLLANDPSLPGQSTLVMLEKPPRFGTLSNLDLNDDGGFIYTPNPGFVGFDSFQYSVAITNNLYASEAQTVSIQVRNEPPVARDDFYPIARDSHVWANVLANDHDPDTEQIRVELVSEPRHGTAVLQPNGELYYLPDPGFAGLEILTYRLFDGAHYSEAAQVGIGTIDGNVAHVMTPSRHHAVLASTPGTRLENVRVLAAPPAAPPAGLSFPLGFFQFEVHGVPLGGYASVTLDLPDSAPIVNEYWKYGSTPDDPTPHWHEFTRSLATGIGALFPSLISPFSGDVLLGFIDGDRGDASGVDGVIVDPGGPVFAMRAPQVAAVAVNDGEAQRSMINSLAVSFDQAVTIERGAFELRQVGARKGVELNVATSVVDGRTVAKLTFKNGRDVKYGSLQDGTYRLSIRADKIKDAVGNLLDGDGDDAAGGNFVDEFFRRLGDADGDDDVDLLDKGLFQSTYGKRKRDPGYLWYFDFNANGKVAREDLGLFALAYCRSNLGNR